MPYDYGGAIASGIPWTAAIIIYPLLPLKISEAAKNAMMGNDRQFFCSEMVAEAYRRAGTPIVPTAPQDTVPGALFYSPNLRRVGYLKYKI